MKKYFVFSDVHSFYDELMKALKEKGFEIDNPEHVVISCGDLFDRGTQAKECLSFIVNMLKNNRAICIKGNHEDLIEDIFEKEYFKGHDFHNGTDKTFDQLCSDDSPWLTSSDIIDNVKNNKDLRYYLDNCLDYYELDNNIFVHGWIPCKPGNSYDQYSPLFPINWREEREEEINKYLWKKARWVNGMDAWDQGIREEGKTIWCGHWHSSWGHSHLHHDGKEFLERIETMYIDPETGKKEPHSIHTTFKDDGIVALDSTVVVSHFINVEVI